MNFQPILGLNGIIAQLDTLVDELRNNLAKKLIELKYLAPGSSPNLIRIRDRCSVMAGKILRNGTTLAQNGIYSVYDGKTICIQILEREENLDSYNVMTENDKMIDIEEQNNKTEIENYFAKCAAGEFSKNKNSPENDINLLETKSVDDEKKIDTIEGGEVTDKTNTNDVNVSVEDDNYSNTNGEEKVENTNTINTKDDKDGERDIDNSNSNNTHTSAMPIHNDLNNAINTHALSSSSLTNIEEKKEKEKEKEVITNKIINQTINTSAIDNIDIQRKLNMLSIIKERRGLAEKNKEESINQSSSVIINSNTLGNLTDSSRKIPTVLLQVQVWERKTYTVGTKFEFFMRQDESLKTMTKCFSSYFQIPIAYLRILYVPSSCEINLCDLPSEYPTKYTTRCWFDGLLESRKVSDLSDTKLVDGDLLLLQNIREPLRVLTEMEMKSVEMKKKLSLQYNESSYHTASSYSQGYEIKSPYFNNFESTGLYGFGSKMKKKESGVIIRTHKERMKENNKDDIKDNKDKNDIDNIPLVLHGPQIAFSESIESLNTKSVLFNTKSNVEKIVESNNEKNPIEVENTSDNLMGNKISEDDREPFLGTEKDANNMGYDLFLDLN